MTLARELLWRWAPGLFERVINPPGQCFSIGIVTGRDLAEVCARARALERPTIAAGIAPDLAAGFVADPFLLRRDDHWYLFFEVFDRVVRLGRIAVAASEDGVAWRYGGVVLRMPWHMAYPWVFENAGEVFMVPDTPTRGITLYRAERFPDRWRFVGTLVAEPGMSDGSPFLYEGRWWMFAGRATGMRDQGSLYLYHAECVEGPWRAHPANPVRTGTSAGSRPAGRVLELDGRLVRPGQDGCPRYGSGVLGYEITELSPTGYAERPLEGNPLLGAGNARWNSGGMHHLDMVVHTEGYLACVDGWYAN